MHCPYCKNTQIKVIDKRDNSESNVTRRRRKCESCNKRFTTYERVEKVLINVLKRDGSVEEFAREKIKHGIMKAVKKRTISTDTIDDIINTVEGELMSLEDNTVRSVDIGELVLREITKIDKLGALLFASVYKEFQSLEDLQRELEKYSTE